MPDSLQTLTHRLVGFFDQGDLDAAKDLAKEIIKLYPGDPFGYKALSAVLMLQLNPQQALWPGVTSVQLGPNDAESHSNLSNIYRCLEQYDKAADACRNAIRLNQIGRAHV